MKKDKKFFLRKTGRNRGVKLYKWSPDIDLKKNKKDTLVPAYFCTTPPGSQGNDFKVTYVYDKVIILGVENRLAYVECDYVI